MIDFSITVIWAQVANYNLETHNPLKEFQLKISQILSLKNQILSTTRKRYRRSIKKEIRFKSCIKGTKPGPSMKKRKRIFVTNILTFKCTNLRKKFIWISRRGRPWIRRDGMLWLILILRLFGKDLMIIWERYQQSEMMMWKGFNMTLGKKWKNWSLRIGWNWIKRRAVNRCLLSLWKLMEKLNVVNIMEFSHLNISLTNRSYNN